MTEYLQQFLTYIENPYIHLPLIVIAAIIAGKLIQVVISKFLLKLTNKTNSLIDDQIVLAVRQPISWTVTLFGVWYAVVVCGLSPELTLTVKRILLTIIIALWIGASSKVATTLIYLLSKKESVSFVKVQTLPILLIICKALVVAIAVYVVSKIWNLDVSAWLASAGIVGIAVGFAAKDTLANLFSGVFIVADSPYKLGDYIVLDGGTRGKVTHIGIRSTRVLTRDDVEVVIPNAVIGNSSVVNQSGGPDTKFRIRVKLGVAYGTDVDHLEKILIEIAEAEDLVSKSPEPRVRFREFGDSSLNFELLCWVKNPDRRGITLHQLNKAIYNKLREESIEIPYPKRDVYLHSN